MLLINKIIISEVSIDYNYILIIIINHEMY